MRPRACHFVLLCLVACSRHDVPATDSTGVVPPPPTPSPAATISDSTNNPASRWVVSPRGIGPILAGLPLSALDTVLREHLRPTPQAGSSCSYVHPAALPAGVLVMVVRDTVARIDVRTKGVLTADSVGIGDAEGAVLSRYEGRVEVTPHKYTGPTGHYLTVTAAPDSAHRIVFETDGKSVVNYRAGRRPEVEQVEGCS